MPPLLPNLSPFPWFQRLRGWLFAQRPGRGSWALALGASVAIAIVYGLLALHQGLGWESGGQLGRYIVQDDARQHVFWMRRFGEPGAFAGDLIADYFAAIAPPGYRLLYQGAALLGIDPLLLNKLLPLPLAIASTVLIFRVTCQILPLPLTGFLAAILFNQTLWFKDDLVSGTSRAFVFPLFLAFFDALLRHDHLSKKAQDWNWLYGLGAIALQALFCPPYVSISVGVLALRAIFPRKADAISASQDAYPTGSSLAVQPGLKAREIVSGQHRWRWLIVGTGVAVAFLLPYLLQPNPFGPVLSAEVAKTWPEFRAGGRTNVFDRDWFDYWFLARGTNFVPRSLLTPVTLAAGLALPLLVWKPLRRRLSPLAPSLHRLGKNLNLLPQLLLASTAMFLAAHVLLFKLHLPSRYTGHSWRIVMAIAAALVWTMAIEALLRWPEHWRNSGGAISSRQSKGKSLPNGLGTLGRGLALAVIFGVILGYPALVREFPANSYRQGQAIALYQFLQQQPIDTVVATLSEEGDNLPSFTGRAIVASREYAVPYHQGYYQQFRQRMREMIAAQYTADPQVLSDFIGRYRVKFWLLDRAAFAPDYLPQTQAWLKVYQPEYQQAIAQQQANQVGQIERLRDRCWVVASEVGEVASTGGWQLLDADCLRSASWQ